MLTPSFVTVPVKWQRRYTELRVLMYLLILWMVFSFLFNTLFPKIGMSFDFRNPSSSKNTISNPRSPENIPLTNGKIDSQKELVANTALPGDFSRISMALVLEKKSDIPEGLSFSLRRTYQSFLYPLGPALSSFPEETIYHIDDTYYALRDGTLFPFVSERALTSRVPLSTSTITEATPDLLTQYPVSEEWLGYRVGSLLSNATGVFVVVSETEIRPIGSAEVFLQLGYNFDDVIPASEEELGIYKRGRIILLGDAHPDGTIFKDTDTNEFFLIEKGMRRPLQDMYRDFLLSHAHPISASSTASLEHVDCSLKQDRFFADTFSCETELGDLRNNPGFEYELILKDPDTDINIKTMTATFVTDMNTENMRSLAARVKQRLLARIGYAQ